MRGGVGVKESSEEKCGKRRSEEKGNRQEGGRRGDNKVMRGRGGRGNGVY